MSPRDWKSCWPAVMSSVVKTTEPSSATTLLGWGMELVYVR